MLRTRPTRGFTTAAILLLSAALAASAQIRPSSNLPATPPTATPQVAPLTATPIQPDAATRAHRAEVRFGSGLISVNANNSSLNSILREIARLTGMKITGGVREERVFGHYGPASPADILATLLGGTGTNMMLRQTTSNVPDELVLTPRGGGPTPPNPNAPGFDSDDRSDEDNPPPARPPVQAVTQVLTPTPATTTTTGPQPIPAPANNPLGNPSNTTPTASTLPVAHSVSTDSIATPSTVTPPPAGIVDSPNPIPAGTVNPLATSPATPTPAATTPEQIFQQLQQLHQQQQQQAKPQ